MFCRDFVVVALQMINRHIDPRFQEGNRSAQCVACGAAAERRVAHYEMNQSGTVLVGWQEVAVCHSCGTVAILRDHCTSQVEDAA